MEPAASDIEMIETQLAQLIGPQARHKGRGIEQAMGGRTAL